jgi:hypothetical protein
VVMNLPCTVVPFSDFTFVIHLCSITKTPCSKLQGTFKLEIKKKQPFCQVLFRAFFHVNIDTLSIRGPVKYPIELLQMLCYLHNNTGS